MGYLSCMMISIYLLMAAAESGVNLESGRINKSFNEITNSFEYECEVEGCMVDITIHRRYSNSYLLTGYHLNSNCWDLPYSKKLAGWTALLQEAKNDGNLNNLIRVGPGPGPEMCKSMLRERLIEVSSRLLSDEDFKTHNAPLIDNSGKYIKNIGFLWEKAETFREYGEIFKKIGYSLKLSEYEGVVLDVVQMEEILKHNPSSRIDHLKIPCNAMTYFEAEKIEIE